MGVQIVKVDSDILGKIAEVRAKRDYPTGFRVDLADRGARMRVSLHVAAATALHGSRSDGDNGCILARRAIHERHGVFIAKLKKRHISRLEIGTGDDMEATSSSAR